MAFFEDCPDANGELLATLGALLEAVALNTFRVFLAGLRANAFQLVDFAAVAAVRANRRPGVRNMAASLALPTLVDIRIGGTIMGRGDFGGISPR